MLKEKHKTIITIIAFSLALILSLGGIFFKGKIANIESTQTSKSVTSSEYSSKLFGSDFINVQIVADESTWKNVIENAQEEKYSAVDVIVNGTKFSNVGIRAKGNSSLMQVARDDSTDRFSFKIKFDEYVDGQTCFGLDTLVLNNMIGDNTYMKEYIAFDMMNYIGADSALYNYCSISVNGNPFGFYLALEGYNDSFESRVYKDTSGNLYSAKANDMAGGNDKAGGFNMDNKGDKNTPKGEMGQNNGMMKNNLNKEDTTKQDTTKQDDSAKQTNGGNNENKDMNNQGMMPQMGGGNSGNNLKYTDDNISSYSGILDNAVGSSSKDSDKKRVIEAIKNLSLGSNLEDYFDVDEVLRYLAAHTVMVNMDSYSSSMCQNYFVYENNSKVSILPWDYGLSFGGMGSKGGSDTSSIINFPIDTPVSGATMEDRPLINKLLEVPEYKEKYHEYLKQIYEGYLAKDKITEKINKLSSMIDSYVKEDASALCTYEEYKNAVSTLEKMLTLRGQSIEGQLNGTIPSTTDGQSENSKALIKDESLNLSLMGGMGNHGGMEDKNNSKNTENTNSKVENTNSKTENTNSKTQNAMPVGNKENMQKIMEIVNNAKDRELTEDEKTQLLSLGATEDMLDKMKNGKEDFKNPPGMQKSNVQSSNIYIYISYIVVMIIGILIVYKYKRKKYRV